MHTPQDLEDAYQKHASALEKAHQEHIDVMRSEMQAHRDMMNAEMENVLTKISSGFVEASPIYQKVLVGKDKLQAELKRVEEENARMKRLIAFADPKAIDKRCAKLEASMNKTLARFQRESTGQLEGVERQVIGWLRALFRLGELDHKMVHLLISKLEYAMAARGILTTNGGMDPKYDMKPAPTDEMRNVVSMDYDEAGFGLPIAAQHLKILTDLVIHFQTLEEEEKNKAEASAEGVDGK
jgi:hypothetical protein